MYIVSGTPERISVSGRVDSSNAAAVEAEISAIVGTGHDPLTVDAEKLDYISSAGLRILLRLKKAHGDLNIVNVSPDVYEIFDMTGFTEMIRIEKAYRVLCVEGCEVIGEGSNGKVYRIDSDTIVKVYKNPDSLSEIHRERELARKAFVMGIPTAIPYDVVKVEGGRYGSVFELLNAKSFAKLLKADPDCLPALARDNADILKTMHATELPAGELPDKKAEAQMWVQYCRDFLPARTADKLTAMLGAVPQVHTMLHGDYHIKNIMRQNGENLLIDMDTLSLGHPVFEFAQMFLAYIGFGELDRHEVEDFLNIPFETANEFWRQTLIFYFGTDDAAFLRDVENKARILGFVRLLRRTAKRIGADTEKGRAIIEHCRAEIIRCVDAVDTLTF